MIGLLQRVSRAEVHVDNERIAAISTGLAVLVGIERGDAEPQAARLLERLLSYRVFPDEQGRMNRSLVESGGELLLIPQFTLPADTRKGTRPSFSNAAEPEHGERLYHALLRLALQRHPRTSAGRFGAHMQLTLTNDGPVTFWLQARPAPRA